MIVKRISAEETFDIRKKVLRENIPLPYVFDGDYDNDTIHLGAFIDDVHVGVASFMKVQLEGFKGQHYQLRGMATLPNYQGQGIGRALLQSAEEILKGLKCDMIWCNARLVAQIFYEKNGYHILGEEFQINHVGPHYKMFKNI